MSRPRHTCASVEALSSHGCKMGNFRLMPAWSLARMGEVMGNRARLAGHRALRPGLPQHCSRCCTSTTGPFLQDSGVDRVQCEWDVSVVLLLFWGLGASASCVTSCWDAVRGDVVQF